MRPKSMSIGFTPVSTVQSHVIGKQDLCMSVPQLDASIAGILYRDSVSQPT